MRSGPLSAYTYGITLEPTTDGGTSATVRLELHPRHWILRPIAHIEGGRFVGNVQKLAARIDEHIRDHSPSPYLKPASPANEERLAYAETQLAKRGIAKAAIDAVITALKSGADADVVRVRPFELAHTRGVDGREVLRALLHGVPLGLVELRWALICPSCRTANDHVASLAELSDRGHCQFCDITYGLDLDRAVEATFTPHPNVRQVADTMFCIGGPWRTPHVIVQANVDAGATRELEAPSETGRFRLFARGGAVASLAVEEGAPELAEAQLDDKLTPAELKVKPGGVVRLENRTDEPLHAKIERLGFATYAATAHDVTTMSEFRRLFSKDLLKPSTPLKVASSAILFSDLTGSTALYTKAGDAAAFRLVDDHFDVLRKAIDTNKGAIVKTMGDAVMAAFTDPIACVRGAVQCLRDFEEFRKTHEHGANTGLKVGLFMGACYVITANGTIDYFGQTVNCASRVQHLAESGELILEAHLFDVLPNDIRDALTVVETFETRVKGVDDALHLVRARLA
jgi:class 3 adenylate cyclase